MDNPVRTARDALLVEAIGDVGKLIERVESLTGNVAPLLDRLQQTQTDVLTVVEQHANKQKFIIDEFVAQEREEVQKALKTAVADATRELKKSGEKMAMELERPPGLPTWKQITIALAIAAATGVMVISGSFWMFGRELSSQAALGRAVMDVWDQLDAKTQERIERAF